MNRHQVVQCEFILLNKHTWLRIDLLNRPLYRIENIKRQFTGIYDVFIALKYSRYIIGL